MPKLIEKHFLIGEDKFHSEIILKKLADKIDKNEFINKPAHVVYIDTSPPQTILASAHLVGIPDERRPAFLDLLKNIDTSDFNSILIFVTVYQHWLDSPQSIIFKKTETKTPLDNFLVKTNGFLIFDYQLEQLCVMGTACGEEQAQSFRKDINARKVSAFEESKKIKIFGLSLHDIISERMKYAGVFNPDYYSAHLLYQHINS